MYFGNHSLFWNYQVVTKKGMPLAFSQNLNFKREPFQTKPVQIWTQEKVIDIWICCYDFVASKLATCKLLLAHESNKHHANQQLKRVRFFGMHKKLDPAHIGILSISNYVYDLDNSSFGNKTQWDPFWNCISRWNTSFWKILPIIVPAQSRRFFLQALIFNKSPQTVLYGAQRAKITEKVHKPPLGL